MLEVDGAVIDIQYDFHRVCFNKAFEVRVVRDIDARESHFLREGALSLRQLPFSFIEQLGVHADPRTSVIIGNGIKMHCINFVA